MKLFLSLTAFGLALAGVAIAAAPAAKTLPKGPNTVIEKIEKPDAEWKKILTPEQYHVLREHGTERAWTSPLNDNHQKGIYVCAACGLPLFSSETKFNSGTGWPSFWAPIAQENVETEDDTSHAMQRIEVHCTACGAHLGHVFNDGPPPTGLRYCLNSVCLEFVPKE